MEKDGDHIFMRSPSFLTCIIQKKLPAPVSFSGRSAR